MDAFQKGRGRWTVGLSLCVALALAIMLVSCEPGRPRVPTLPATPTTAPDPGDVLVTGQVFDALRGRSHALPAAVVSAMTCEPGRLPADVGDDGKYSLQIPSEAVRGCTSVTVEVRAPGFEDQVLTFPMANLRGTNRRDLALWPVSEGGAR